MDPAACFQRMYRAVCDNDFAEAREAATDLREWMDGGGFPPEGFTGDAALAMCNMVEHICA
jgi:hypothetical protein